MFWGVKTGGSACGRKAFSGEMLIVCRISAARTRCTVGGATVMFRVFREDIYKATVGAIVV